MIKKTIIFLIFSLFFLSGCEKKEPPLETPGDYMVSQNNHSNNAENETSPKGTLEESNMDNRSELPIKKDGQVSDELMELASEKLALLPKNIEEAFFNDGWEIYLTDMDLNLTFYNGKYASVLGNTIYGEGIIYIENNKEAVQQALLHEVGHWLDFHLGYLSDKEEFQTIFKNEAACYMQDYQTTCVRNSKELFAESFWQYLENPQKLELLNPELYWFMKNTISNVQETYKSSEYN